MSRQTDFARMPLVVATAEDRKRADAAKRRAEKRRRKGRAQRDARRRNRR